MQLLFLIYVWYKSTSIRSIFYVTVDSRYTYVHHILNRNRYKCGFSGVNDKLSYNNARKSPL